MCLSNPRRQALARQVGLPIALALVAVAPLLSAVGDEDGPQELPWPVTGGAAPGYAPDSACAECHEERLDSFGHSPMSRSFCAMTPDRLVEDLDHSVFHHEASGNWYEMVRRGDEIYQRRWRIDANGERYAEFERRIDWVMGSGMHARTYLTQLPSGEIFQLPVSWYTGQGFGMSPGYDHADHEGFHRPIRRRCMFCHNSFAESPLGSDQYGELDRYTTELPEGIACQRCHGPGAKHALLALDPGADEQAIRDAIVYPRELDPVRQNDLCFQCHLQPTSAVEDAVRRLGRGSHSFHPGEPLEDYQAQFDVLEARPTSKRFEINHHAFRMLQSPCFLGSGGRLTCITCHSPHTRPTVEERPAYYRRKCLQCHEPDACTAEPPADAHAADMEDCAGCHMPKHRTEDVVLATATDHLIRRAPAPDEWLAPLEEDEHLELQGSTYLFADRGPDGPELELLQALFQVRNGSTANLEQLREAIDRVRPETVEPWLDLGDGYLAAGLPQEAIRSFERVTELAPERSVGWRKLGRAQATAGRAAAAERSFTRAVELEPDHPDNQFALAEVLGRDRLKPALEHYRIGLDLRPNDPEALAAMASLLLRNGRFARAAAKFEQAVDSAPREAESYRGLATARLQQGRWDAALTAWGRGAEIAPRDADFQRKLAFGRLVAEPESLRDAGAALEHAERAAELSPGDADVATELALAHHLEGHEEEALAALRRAEELDADPVVTSGIAALVHDAAGRTQLAERARRRALAARGDSGAGALRSHVLERLGRAPGG